MPKYRDRPMDLMIQDSDIQTMFNNAKNERERALISILWKGGPRPGEIRKLQRKHISWNFEQFSITFQTLKLGNTKKFVVPFRTLVFQRPRVDIDRYIETIINFADHFNPEDKVLPMTARWQELVIDRLGFAATGKHITPYHIRHWCFTWTAKENNMSLPELKHMKGAASAKSVEPYLEAIPMIIGKKQSDRKANVFVVLPEDNQVLL
jgi:integrase